jgi:hypothetical protein
MNTTRSNWKLCAPVLARLATVAAALFAASACETVEQDAFVSRQGTSPDPTAVLEGTILYSGPAPKCKTDGDTKQRRVQGNVVLQLYLFDNPPFPEGTAASSENLLVVSGDQMFTPEDCLAGDANPDTAMRVARSVPFRWPGLAVRPSEASYQIRGFYDYDEDFIPMFSATRQPTEGDIMGAAVNDVQEPERGPLKITIPAVGDAIDGYVARGISVALGVPLWTERPAFKLNDSRKLAATSPYDVVMGMNGVDAVATQQKFRGLTCPGGKGDGISCGLSIDPMTKSDAAIMNKAGVSLDVDDATAYAFWVHPIDMTTIRPDDFDSARTPDGVPDPHPTLGGIGVDWYAPIFMLSRLAYTLPDTKPPVTLETQARIPQVRLLGSVLLGEQPPASPLAFGRGSVPMSVPPVAVVELAPNRPECRVPYFPPGSTAAAIEGRVGHCGELPTGRYAATVVDGLMGERPTGNPPVIDPTKTIPSQQSWAIPNELGDPDQLNKEPANSMPSQGASGAFLVHSPAERPMSCPVQPAGLCPGNQPGMDPAGADTATCLPSNCCNEVAHLCGVPLCETEMVGDVPIRKGPTKITGTTPAGVGIPDCIPFEMPRVCCPNARK